MKPFDYQVELANKAKVILSKHNIVYLACEERTGKSLAGLLAVDGTYNKVLVLTKKAALEGWQETLDGSPQLKSKYTLTNYHGACKLTGSFDVVILDESHAYVSAVPKKSKYGKIWNDVRVLTQGLPIVYMSATPSAQGYYQLYNQFKLSDFTPYHFDNFYRFYEKFGTRDKNGNLCMIKTSGERMAKDYHNIQASAKEVSAHLFITKTRKELNFKEEPKDIIHDIQLSPTTKKYYNILLKNKVIVGKDKTLLADTGMKLRTSLHMMEGGVLKIDDEYLVLKNQEKIEHIKKKWGDKKNMAIMYQYIAEGTKLRAAFKNAQILQGITYAEGIDLSHIEHLIIYSQDFSTSRHTQRRARQANIKRNAKIDVHFLLVKGAISEQVYRTVSINKRNFVDKYFQHKAL